MYDRLLCFFKNLLDKKKSSLITLILILILFFPVSRLFYVYLNTFFKSYTLEINEGSGKIKRFAFKKKGEKDNLLFHLYNERQSFGEIESNEISLDEYYDRLFKQYKIANDFYDNALSLETELVRQKAQSSGSDKVEIIGVDESQTLGELQDLKVVHSFDGLEEDQEEASSQYGDPKVDKVPQELDYEGDQQLKTYYQEQEVKDYKEYSTSVREESYPSSVPAKFKPSAPPKESGDNQLSDLKKLKLVLNKGAFYSYEIVRLNLVAPGEINLDDLKIYVKRKNYIFPNLGGVNDFFFKYKDGYIYSTVTIGYQPSKGEYTLLVKSRSNPDWKGLEKKFVILRRRCPPVQKGFSVANLEYTKLLKKTVVRGPHKVGGYEQIASWCAFMDVDMLWMLAAQTVGWNANISSKNPWVETGLKNVDLLGPVLKKKGIGLGAYIMSYFTPGNGKNRVGYDPSLSFTAGEGLGDSRHISLNSQKRLDDIIQMVKRLDSNPNVSFIGLDFIRTGRADGYEMGPQVIEEMNIRVPKAYHKLSYIEKIKWFAKRVEVVKDKRVIAKWRWWRAHKVASIVNEVIQRSKLKKPLWVFTLGWRHGKEHGQDPYMFFDAGVFIDAVMLYEANKAQFKNMMIQWPSYMRDSHNNVIIGNATDVRFLDGSKSSKWGNEYLYRSQEGYRKIYGNSYAKGIFMHDLSRMLWSSNRGIDAKEWGIVHGHATSAYRQELGLIPYTAKIAVQQSVRGKGQIEIVNKTKQTIRNITLSYVKTRAWTKVTHEASHLMITLKPNEKKTINFKARRSSQHQKKSNIMGFKLSHKSYRPFYFFAYL